MKLTIKGTEKEIAALVLAIQERREERSIENLSSQLDYQVNKQVNKINHSLQRASDNTSKT